MQPIDDKDAKPSDSPKKGIAGFFKPAEGGATEGLSALATLRSAGAAGAQAVTAKCPVCSRVFVESLLNDHLDICLLGEEQLRDEFDQGHNSKRPRT